MTLTQVGVAIHIVTEALLVARVMMRPNRGPASRIAWIAVIAALPLFGMLVYLLLGETSIGRRRVQRMKRVVKELQDAGFVGLRDVAVDQAVVPERYEHLFRTGRSISGFDAVGGNSARLLADANVTIDAMVADIDAAAEHVHVLFYIWLPDGNGLRMVEALRRAATRGVTCRAMADALGSRTLIRSPHWKAMQAAGVHVAVALPINNPLLRPFQGRIDLRNHRKILVVDGRVTYCGSQNCADAEFLVKAKYAPWVDAMVRFEGPIVRQNQTLFACDWMCYTDEDLRPLLQHTAASEATSDAYAQVIATGPTVRHSAMPEMFESLFHAARRELTITTPYYVPDESLQSALCAAAWRGVATTIIFPAKNDSWIVGAASRSYYADLLKAGVNIYEYVGGLLHTKSLTLDGEITLIGSANMDRRSFELNYENNILCCDAALTAAVRARQQAYIAQSRLVTREMVESWSLAARLWNNTLASLGPVL
jgi:cardiolipin synthase